MITIRIASLVCLSSVLFACQEGSVEGNAADEVVGAPATDALTPVVRAFNFKDGASNEEALRSGDCFKALVAPVEGIPTYLVKKFENGAIMTRNGKGPGTPLCVDVHGANKVSFSGVMLDAVARFGLGHFKDVLVRPGQEEGMEVNFVNGTMKVFRGTGRPEDGRYKWATQDPTDHGIQNDGPCIAGLLQSITLDQVKVTNILVPGVSTRSVDIDGGSIWLAYRYAWQNTENPDGYAMNDTAVGIFERTAKTAGDAGGSFTLLNFTKSDLRHDEYEDPTVHTESIKILPPESTDFRVKCDRMVPLDHTMRPPFFCLGLVATP